MALNIRSIACTSAKKRVPDSELDYEGAIVSRGCLGVFWDAELNNLPL
jgi:hypothetical protein